jgi:predicted porin
MKKIAIATLLVASTMVATAQVRLTGKVSEFVDNTKTGAVSKTSLVSDPTSNITLSASEKIIGTLTANVVLDTSLSANDPIGGADTKLGNRQSTIGLSSKVGSIDLGRNLHSHFLAITNNDAFGTLYGSVAGDVHNVRGLRVSNGTFFALKPISGVTATYDRTQNGVGTEASSYSASAKLFGINATVAQYTQGIEKSTVYAGSAKLGNTQVFYSHSDDKGLVAKTGDLIGASQQFGQLTAKASYGKTNTDVKAYALGADYNLSKRTALGVNYRNVDATGTANDVKQVGVGVTHRF